MIDPSDGGQTENIHAFLSSSTSDSEDEINKAYEESVKGESILPILKQELRFKIQSRRLSEGQGELKPEKSEPKVYELTEEEKQKYQRRLEQNRDSLRRARKKELEHEKQLKQMYNTESSRGETLRRQKAELLKEKEMLMKNLKDAGIEWNESKSVMTCIYCKQTLNYTGR